MNDTPKPINDAQELFESNKSFAALCRDSETRIAKAGAEGGVFTVDLRTVPRDQWDRWLGFHAAVPSAIASYLNGRTELTRDEVPMLEAAMEKELGIEAPYYITVSETLLRTGRAWRYVPEAGRYLTGFNFDKQR